MSCGTLISNVLDSFVKAFFFFLNVKLEEGEQRFAMTHLENNNLSLPEQKVTSIPHL